MLTLIKREIEDAIVYFALTALFIAVMVARLAYKGATGWGSEQIFGVPSVMYTNFALFWIAPLVAAALGACQMSLDRDKKISSFLVTQATTRRRILAAKMITGLLWVLGVIVPIAITDMVLFKMFPMAAVPDAGFLARLFVIFFLCMVACYCFGLQLGWRAGGFVPAALGVVLITAVLVSLIVVKGFGLQTMAFYLLFAAAAMVRTWQKFMTTSL